MSCMQTSIWLAPVVLYCIPLKVKTWQRHHRGWCFISISGNPKNLSVALSRHVARLGWIEGRINMSISVLFLPLFVRADAKALGRDVPCVFPFRFLSWNRSGRRWWWCVWVNYKGKWAWDINFHPSALSLLTAAWMGVIKVRRGGRKGVALDRREVAKGPGVSDLNCLCSAFCSLSYFLAK